MHRARTSHWNRIRVRAAFAGLALAGLAFADQDDVSADGALLGTGEHRYRWERAWPEPPGGAFPGNTHGSVLVDPDGRVWVNTDTESAVMVFEADGTFVRSTGADLAGGLHGMVRIEEEGEARLVCAHTGLGVVCLSLAGAERWRLEPPEDPEVYGEDRPWRPTSVAYAPNGELYVADGYGQNRVHRYDRDRHLVAAIGGPGDEPGRFRTPHGIAVDTRGDESVLLVADRENGRLQSLTLAGEPIAVIAADHLRRPCSVAIGGEHLAIADLNGRVTILDGENELVAHLGDNPDEAQWANNGLAPETWRTGVFLAPHSAAWSADGDLYVVDWNSHGRLTKLTRVRD